MRLIEGAVLIRDFEINDIQRKVQWINNPRNNEYLHYDIPLTLAKTETWFLNKDNSKRRDCVIEFNNTPVGLIGLLSIDRINNKAEFYISMGEHAFKKKGIATVATKLLLKYAFNELKLHKVYLNVDEKNIAACSLYEKVGFKCEGIFNDELLKNSEYINRKRYAMMNSDMNKLNSLHENTNILLLSVGTRNKIVEYFKNSLKGTGQVIAADMSELSTAIYIADKYYIVPPIFAPDYIDRIIDICEYENVKGVLSLIDPELSILAQNSERFESIGTMVIGSDFELCEMSLDKYQMYQWLTTNNYKCAKSWVNVNEFFKAVDDGGVQFPVVLKPVRGSASNRVIKAYNKEIVNVLFNIENDFMIQEYLDGQEIGADVYIDLISGEVISIFTKKKIRMRAGETDKAVSFKDPKLFELIERFVAKAGFRGQIDIDLFLKDGEYYISEVNPRFGGGYPHAYESGADHMSYIINNLLGQSNQKCIGDYTENTYMMKYNEVLVREG